MPRDEEGFLQGSLLPHKAQKQVLFCSAPICPAFSDCAVLSVALVTLWKELQTDVLSKLDYKQAFGYQLAGNILFNSQIRTMFKCGCRLSPKQGYHQALVKMSESLLILGFPYPRPKTGRETRCAFRTSGRHCFVIVARFGF